MMLYDISLQKGLIAALSKLSANFVRRIDCGVEHTLLVQHMFVSQHQSCIKAEFTVTLSTLQLLEVPSINWVW